MDDVPARRTNGGDNWLRPRTDVQGFARYVATLRAGWWVVLLAVVVTTAAAGAYVALAPKVYESQANILVTPVSASDPTTTGLGLITDSNDPTRVVSTAAELIRTQPVASLAKGRLLLSKSPDEILGDVTAEPVAQSNLVAITAKGSSPGAAARLANAFARSAVDIRTGQLHSQLDGLIPQLQRTVGAQSAAQNQAPTSLAARLATLQSLRGAPDPTVRVASIATAPTSPSSPKKRLSLIAGLIAGLILGIGAAFGLQALDPRLRREEQLRELFSIPVLARIPVAGRTEGGPLTPNQVYAPIAEAYRTLRATLTASSAQARSILVTGSSPAEGKTTTAINLAYAIAHTGRSVILIEADLRRPAVGPAFGIRPRHGIDSVLLRDVSLEDALIVDHGYDRNLMLLLVERGGLGMVDRLSLPTARQLIREAEKLADYVIIDSPPLSEVTDVLPLAQHVDDVLIVARLGHSRLNKLAHLGELLAQQHVRPAGIALVGVKRTPESAYYQEEDVEGVLPQNAESAEVAVRAT